VQRALGPTKEIVIVGKRDAEDTRQMIQQAHRTYLPDAVLLFKPEGEPTETLDTIASFTKEQHTLDGRATVYVCEHHACRAPATEWPLS
jgi:uncharacterized protein YyaL (SSP411 family)